MKDKIIEKLKKLIRHEQSARAIGNVDEAAAFAMKIQELLDAYNLSLSEIDIAEARESVSGTNYPDLRMAQLWQKNFLGDLAEIHGCRMILSSSGAIIVGSEIDREIVVELYRYFEALGQHLCDRHVKAWQQTPNYRRKRKKTFYTRRYKTAYLIGYQSALLERIQEQQDLDKQQASNETAMIYIGNKLADASTWVDSNLRVETTKPKSQKIRSDAFHAGRAAGRSVALTTKTIF